ncbi:cytochrome c oxidase assembly protein [Virgibacillus sp. W0430]|uniref:cytochrome c oxidase assembly protein n=1 Tax=Virgibacillus sp. W0430 TaxID=3391580 RepID=UPI003F44CCFA
MMNSSLFANYEWFQLFNPLWLLLIAIVSFLYMKTFIGSNRYVIHKNQRNYFYCALGLLYIIHGTPIAIAARDYLFSVHVLQLAITFFIIVPLLILSLPAVYIRNYFWNYKMKFMITILGHPWLTAIAFNGLLTLYLLPPIFNTLKENSILLTGAQFVLLINAFLMWWVIISPVPQVSNTAYLTRVAYIFFTSILLMPIGIFFLVIQKAHYPFYEASAGAIFPVLTAIYDQQLAGGLLKITQLASYTYAMLFIVMSWGRKEEEKEGKVDDENIRVARGVVIHLHRKKKERRS